MVFFYMAYAVMVNKINKFIWLGIGLIIAEVVVFFFKMICPLTIMARKYSDSSKENFDIYLPNWLAKYNRPIYTVFFIIIIMGIVYRILQQHV